MSVLDQMNEALKASKPIEPSPQPKQPKQSRPKRTFATVLTHVQICPTSTPMFVRITSKCADLETGLETSFVTERQVVAIRSCAETDYAKTGEGLRHPTNHADAHAMGWTRGDTNRIIDPVFLDDIDGVMAMYALSEWMKACCKNDEIEICYGIAKEGRLEGDPVQ